METFLAIAINYFIGFYFGFYKGIDFKKDIDKYQ